MERFGKSDNDEVLTVEEAVSPDICCIWEIENSLVSNNPQTKIKSWVYYPGISLVSHWISKISQKHNFETNRVILGYSCSYPNKCTFVSKDSVWMFIKAIGTPDAWDAFIHALALEIVSSISL